MIDKKRILPILFSFFALSFVTDSFAEKSSEQNLKKEPLVIVVHGVGGGNRKQGWSDQIVDQWGIPKSYVEEINFNYKGRTSGQSVVDFARMGWQWGDYVRKELDTLTKKYPDRPVIIVAHSWGTVAATMALNGAETNQGRVETLRLPKGRISRLITLGSPLGRAVEDDPGSLVQLGIDVNITKPRSVAHWTNIADRHDPVSKVLQKLPHADENIIVGGSAGFVQRI